MRLTSIALLFILSLFVSNPILAQETHPRLREVLQTVEQRFNVSFTFLDATIDDVFLEAPPSNLSFQETLNYLNQKTGLTFTELNQRFITISRSANKQIDICGYIIDQETRENIVGATIQSGSLFSVTNEFGYFILHEIDNQAILSIKALGYKTLSITAQELLGGRSCKTLGLNAQPAVLSEVLITDFLTTGIKKIADGSFSIQTKDLSILPGLTEADVLFTIQSLPGIQSMDETVSNINVRGGTHDQNLVLWDGIKMYQQGHFFGLISAFNPYLTKEVNLIKNGTSTFHGDGVSSTLDIRSEDDVSHAFSGGAGVSMISVDEFVRIPTSKKSTLHLASRRSIADAVKTPTYQQYYDRAFRGTEVAKYDPVKNDTTSQESDFRFYDISGKFLYDISNKEKLRISFLTLENRINNTETEIINKQVESRISSLRQRNTAGGVSYNRLWNSRFRTTVLGYISKYDLGAINFDILNDQRLIQDNRVLDLGIKLDSRIALTSNLDLFSGYQFSEVGVSNLESINNPRFYRLRKTVLHTHVAFSELNFSSPSGNTNIRAGFRGNLFIELDRVRVEPRLSFNHKISKHISLELLGEMKSQTTTQIIDFQNDFLGVEKRRWVMTNDKDVPVIKSEQLSLGVHFAMKNFLITLEGYNKHVSDIITSSQGFQNQFQFVRSTGSYRAIGIDFLINRRIKNINSWASYSYGVNSFYFKDLLPPKFPHNLDIRHRATSGLSYQSKHLELSVGINWHTGRPFTGPISNTSIENNKIQYRAPNTSRLDNYWRLDASAKYKFKLSSDKLGFVAGVSIWNLVNRNNVVDAYYLVDDAGAIVSFERNALGLTPNIMLRVEF